jgi:paraquat-inducible protein B
MSKEVNRIAIGGFVVGAIGLAILAILVFGSGRFFQQKTIQVLFFEGSVKGLNIGAPVKFRGVDIGLVNNIKLAINPADLKLYVPVYVEIFTDSLSVLEEANLEKGFKGNAGMDKLVNELGLRGQLQMQSFVTGQLFINYDFYPETPVRKVGLEKKIYEVPTIPTTLQMLTDTAEKILSDLRKVNFREIVDNIAQTAEGVNELVNSDDMRETVANFNSAIQDIQKLARNTDVLVATINGKVDTVADSFSSAMQDTRKLVNNIDSKVNTSASDIKDTLTAVQSSFARAESLLAEAQKLIAQNSKLRREITMTLESLSDASRSMEELTDYLERHPDSIIRGKQ